MKITMPEPNKFKDSISVISELVGEGTFKLTKNSMKFVAMDPANVAMVLFTLTTEGLTECDLKGEEENISVNISNLKGVLGRLKADDALTMDTGIEKGKVEIKYTGKSTRTFSLPLIDDEDKPTKVPDLKFDSNIKFDSSVLNDIIEDASIVGSSVVFNLQKKDLLEVSSEGDLSKAKIEIPKSEKVKITMEKGAKSKFSLDYLRKIVKGSKISSDVEVFLKDDYPLKVTYKKDNIELSFVLAPRVEND